MDYLRGGEGRSRAKCVVRVVGKAIEVDGVLRGWRLRRAPGEAVEVDDMLWGWRWRCASGEAVEGTLHRWRRAPGIGGIEELQRVSSKTLLSVELAARAPDIYIGG
jgi:hypothetical protein